MTNSKAMDIVKSQMMVLKYNFSIKEMAAPRLMAIPGAKRNMKDH
jgi:hypothetical protein